MNKKLLFLVGGAGIMLTSYRPAHSKPVSGLQADSVPHQYAWKPYVSLEKKFTITGTPTSYLKYAAKHTIYMCGYWDTARIVNIQGTRYTAVLGDSNTLMCENGVWRDGGKISFKNSYSIVYFRGVLNGVPYITTMQNDSVGKFASNIFRLNLVSNRFEPVTDITFDSGVRGFMSLGNSKVFVWGVFYQAKDKNGVKPFNGAALWDMSTNTLSQIQSKETLNGCACGLSSISGNTFDMSESDSTLMVVLGNQGGARMYMVRAGMYGWADSLYPSIQNGSFVAVNVISKDRMYAILEKKDSVGEPCYLLRLRNNQWQSIGRIMRENVSDEVFGLEHANGKLYISGPCVSFNGDSVGHTFIYDTLTGAVTALPKDPFVSGWPKLKLLDKRPCLYDMSNTTLPLMLYALRDTLTSITMSGPDTTVDQHVNLTVSVTGPKDSVTIYEQKSGSSEIITYWLQADDGGKIVLPLTLQPGTYTFSGFTTNADGWPSPLKTLHTVTVSTVTAVGNPGGGIGATNNGGTATGMCFPNPAHTEVWINKYYKNIKVYTIDGKQVLQEILQATQNSRVDVSNLASGMYIFVCKTKNHSDSYKIVITH